MHRTIRGHLQASQTDVSDHAHELEAAGFVVPPQIAPDVIAVGRQVLERAMSLRDRRGLTSQQLALVLRDVYARLGSRLACCLPPDWREGLRETYEQIDNAHNASREA